MSKNQLNSPAKMSATRFENAQDQVATISSEQKSKNRPEVSGLEEAGI